MQVKNINETPGHTHQRKKFGLDMEKLEFTEIRAEIYNMQPLGK